MATRFLLGLTPRAGSKNYRYLVSPSSGLDEIAASKLMEVAFPPGGSGTRAAGPHFVAVRRPDVLQASGDRTGEEVLLLGGIGADSLGESRGQDLLVRLERRMPDFKKLIDGIDWEHHKGLLVERKELGDWLCQDFPAVPAVRLQRAFWKWAFGLVLAIGVLGGLVLAIRVLGGWACPVSTEKSSQGPSGTSHVKPKDGLEGPEEQFSRFMQRYNIPSAKRDDAKLELAAFFDGQGNKAEPATILEDSRIASFLEDALGKNPPRPDHFVKDDSQGGPLRNLSAGLKPEQVTKMRGCLVRIGQCFDPFPAKTAGQELDALKLDACPCLNFARELAHARNSDQATKCRPATPLLPFFDRCDVQIVDKLQGLLASDASKKIGINKEVLSDQLQELQEKEEAINIGLSKDRQRLRETDPQAAEGDAILRLKSATEDFLADFHKLDLSPLKQAKSSP